MTDYRPILERYFGKFEIDRVLNSREEVNGFQLILVSPGGKPNFMPSFGGIGGGVPGIAGPILESLTNICETMQKPYKKQIIDLEFETERRFIEEEKRVENGIKIKIKVKEQQIYKRLSDIFYGVGICARNYYDILRNGGI